MTEGAAIVVGAGVMGLSAGCALAARGVEVTLLERYTVAHEWASSHGLSRAIRHEYGSAAPYSEMVARSLPLWRSLAEETGRHLYTETGVLTLGYANDGHTMPGLDVMRGLGLPVERLTHTECVHRFPQFRPDEYDVITWNPTGGMLHANECLVALTERFRRLGGHLMEHSQVVSLSTDSSAATVIMADGSRRQADVAVLTAGPWVHDLVPELHLPVRTTRQQVCYLTGLPSDQFGMVRFPVFLAAMEFYGFPVHGPGWMKVGSHVFGEAVDPNVPYVPDTNEVEAVRAFLRRTIPDASRAEVISIDRCMYDVTPDEDFILDYYPGTKRIVVGTGFSGHGFKFGVLIGDILAALALQTAAPVPLDRFALSRFGKGADQN